MSRRALVCGSRDWSDREILYGCLDALDSVEPFSVIIEGEAAGADTMAREWAEAHGVPVIPFPADWSGKGRAAGPIRNRQMLVEGQPDVVIAFTNKPLEQSRGTANMIEQTRKARILLHVIDSDGNVLQ